MLSKLLTEEEFLFLREEWNSLLDAGANPSVFLTHEWLSTWWRTFAEGKRLFIVNVQHEGQLLGLAPLFIDQCVYSGLVKLRVLRLLGMNEIEPDYLGFIIRTGYEGEVTREILQHLLSHRAEWDLIQLDNMLDSNSTDPSLTQIARSELGLSIHVDRAKCPFIRLPGSFEKYLSGFSRKHRYNLNRLVKILKKSFDYEFGIAASATEAKEAMRTLFVLHEQRAQQMRRGSAFCSKQVLSFHTELIPALFSQGLLKVFYVKLNGRIESCLYAYAYNGRFYFYQSGFNPAYDKYSLGSVTLMEAIRSSIEEGLQEFDFLKGQESYKYLWANGERETISLTIGNGGLRSWSYLKVIKMRRLMGKVVRSGKALYAKRRGAIELLPRRDGHPAGEIE